MAIFWIHIYSILFCKMSACIYVLLMLPSVFLVKGVKDAFTASTSLQAAGRSEM